MRLTLASALLTSFLLFYFQPVSAQKGDEQPNHTSNPGLPHTLLWRIQGKGMQKPSYLFGTMHVMTRSAFYFGDSLYAALEGADGFAMEVHPDSILGPVLRHELERAKSKMLKDVLAKKDLDKINVKAKKALGISLDSLTLKDAYMLKEKLSLPSSRPDDMSTFVDAYLYSIARDKDKRIAGLEKADDQVAILGNLEEKFDAKTLASNDGKEEGYLDRMLKVYQAQNLNAVDSMIKEDPDDIVVTTMVTRNKVMLHSMDSLFRDGTYFVAVGAAHLPGETGLIRLLKSEGYAVEPVFSSKKIEPGKYVFKTEHHKPWVVTNAPDDGYQVSFPAKPQGIAAGAGVNVKIWMDIATGTFFEITSIPLHFRPGSAKMDSLYKVMLDGMTSRSNSTLLRKEHIRVDSLDAVEADMENTVNHLWIQARLFSTGKRIFIVASGSTKTDTVFRQNKARFYESLSLFPPVIKDESHVMVDSTFHFSIMAPAKDYAEKIQADSISVFGFHTFNDDRTGNVFSITLTKSQPGHSLPTDTASLRYSLEHLRNSYPGAHMEGRDTVVLGCHALSISGALGTGDSLLGLVVKRGNYKYGMIALGHGDSLLQPEADRYFRSFSLSPYGRVAWANHAETDQGYTVMAPAYVYSYNAISAASTRAWVDTVQLESYGVHFRMVNPFAFASSDSLFLARQLMKNRNKRETFHARYFNYQGFPALKFLMDSAWYSNRETGCLYLVGDRVYLQTADVLDGRANSDDVRTFLESIRFTDTTAKPGAIPRSPTRLFGALYSQDTALRRKARIYLDTAVFEEKDLGDVLNAMSGKVNDDDSWGWHIRYQLIGSCKKFLSNSSLPLLCRHYRAITNDSAGMGYTILVLVAGIKTSEARDSLVGLMHYRLPLAGDAYTLVSALEDSLPLAKGILKDLVFFQQDLTLGNELYQLYNQMLDKGTLTISAFSPFEQSILKAAYAYVDTAKPDKDEMDYSFDEIADFLKRFRDTAVAAYFRHVVALPNMSDKFSASCALLYLGQTPPGSALQALGADTYWRLPLYDSLAAYHKKQLFPAAYLTQHSMAVGYLERGLNADNDDGVEHDRISFLREGIYLYNGKKSKFLLFDVRFPGNDTSSLGVVGPYPVGSVQLLPDSGNRVSDVNFQRKLDLKKLDEEVRELLKQQEEWLRKKDLEVNDPGDSQQK